MRWFFRYMDWFLARRRGLLRIWATASAMWIVSILLYVDSHYGSIENAAPDMIWPPLVVLALIGGPHWIVQGFRRSAPKD
jgi:hypothetical protein